jgi:hypothetical protein
VSAVQTAWLVYAIVVRHSWIVASMVKRQEFSQLAYGTGMHRIDHEARITAIISG